MTTRLLVRTPNHPDGGRLLLYPPPTLRRGFNGLCTSNDKVKVSGAKARRPLRQAQGGSSRSTNNARAIDLPFKNEQIYHAQSRR